MAHYYVLYLSVNSYNIFINKYVLFYLNCKIFITKFRKLELIERFANNLKIYYVILVLDIKVTSFFSITVGIQFLKKNDSLFFSKI